MGGKKLTKTITMMTRSMTRIAELEARIVELEKKNERLQKQTGDLWELASFCDGDGFVIQYHQIEHNGTSPVPAVGEFKYSIDVGGYEGLSAGPYHGRQQPGTFQVASGTATLLYSPQITIGSTTGWGIHSPSQNAQNKTTHIYVNAQTDIVMSAACYSRAEHVQRAQATSARPSASCLVSALFR